MLLVGVLAVAPGAEGSDHLDDLRITLELRDRPLHEALAGLGQMAGVLIRITGPGEKHRVSVRLRDVAFWKGLND